MLWNVSQYYTGTHDWSLSVATAMMLSEKEWLALRWRLVAGMTTMVRREQDMLIYIEPGLKRRIWNRFKALAGWN